MNNQGKAELQLNVQAIDHNSDHLLSVMNLWRVNANWLGRMPKGGFMDYAARRHIIVGLDSEEQCVGYLMYRIVDQEARVVHLCVDKEYRGRGIAKKLMTYLSRVTQKLQGISLWCRRDYPINTMWHAFGFVPLGDKCGNNRDGKLLTFWRRSHNPPNLISILFQQKVETKLCVAIDADIFYDLYIDDDIDKDSQEAKSLLADWLQPNLELCLTNEIFNYINLKENSETREKLRQFAETFVHLHCSQEKFEAAYQLIRNCFSENLPLHERSNFHQLARAIASNAQFFVTLNQNLLNIEDKVYKKSKILIISPTDLIIRLDELRRETEYQPTRLSGTFLDKIRIKSGQQNLVLDRFLSYSKSEDKQDLQRRIRQFLGEPERFECFVIWENQENPVALIVYDRQETHELRIPLLRVKHDFLSPTIVRHLILLSISTSAKEQRHFTKIVDPFLEDITVSAIRQDNFIQVDTIWLKVNLATVDTASQLAIQLSILANQLGRKYNLCFQIANILNSSCSITNTHRMADIEKILWPAKIIDANIYNFVVPIKPIWAEALFDERLANQSCLENSIELALRREVVYYRSVKNPGGLQAPGRILWYVSQDKRSYCQEEIGAIRACSRLDEVIVGQPKILYQQFRRLGVYTYNDIQKINNNIEGNIMAIKFSDTEVFNNPISFTNAKKIAEGKISVRSPYKISNDTFKELYNLGIST